VALAEAYGRVLAEPVIATDPVPPFAGSMVDGFAVRVADVAGASEDAPVELRIIGDAMAGAAPPPAPRRGEALRIMTGAPAPEGTEAVVMLEWTEWREDRVLVKRPARAGQALRAAGEDVAAGTVVLEPGTVLGPAAVGVCASVGRPTLRVHRRPQVAILATGDELLAPDEPLTPGRIRSSNDWTLVGQVREAGALVASVGLARDDAADLRARLERGAQADVLLTSGGVSVGDRDLVQPVLTDLGFEKVFWRVAASPGKPLLFGRLGATLVFGLPGNPVSSSVAFENFVRPALRVLQGDARPDRTRAMARAAATISGPEDRRHFARVRITAGADGLVAHEVGPHGSGNLSSVMRANGLAIVPEGRARIEVGESAEVILLSAPDPSPGGEG